MAANTFSRLILSIVLTAGGACGGATVAVPAPAPETAAKPPRPGSGYPGFDKRDFPGASRMRSWYETSPYHWVAYYLPAPCFAGTAWSGHRQELVDQGWGLAVVYVGLQAPRAASASGSATSAAPSTEAMPTRCSLNRLSVAQGTADGDDAANAASAEGFAAGTRIFLDVERADPYPTDLDAYVRAWGTQVLARGFVPGIYAHRTNASALFTTMKAVYAAAGEQRQPPFWVANSQGFDFARSPAESGFSFATVWQSPTDAEETYGGVTFRVDRNVAASKNP